MAKTASSRRWLREHANDPFVKLAKDEGLRSRAAYKLRELNERERLLGPGMTVVDLGSAPGGWSQVAADFIKPKGRVVAVDLIAMKALNGVTFIQGDMRAEDTFSAMSEVLGGRKADIVMSDMAPNLSGINTVDQSNMLGLAELALQLAQRFLRPRQCIRGSPGHRVIVRVKFMSSPDPTGVGCKVE